ncbi:GrpB family protein [Parageobacillus toebii]|uniref:GrpB family protein n=1 Tax=Parageobacillus toebii TaxID=153151 RepID=UPI002E22E945|nr:GrpB family protein [Parageobacillus toebii]
MEIVHFFEQSYFHEQAEKTFLEQKEKILRLLPEADIQHVGSTAIPNSLTKGDLDIQVRVPAEIFTVAVEKLSALYAINEGSVQTDYFRAFQDDTTDPPLGVQLTVIGSELDIFWKFREVLLANDTYRAEYDELKKAYEGKSMEAYREAKQRFFARLMETPEFQRL